MSSDSSIGSRISRGLKASLGGRVIYIGSNSILVLLLTRELLEPAGFGRLFFALSVLGVISLFASLGIPKSAARYVTEYVERDETQIRYILRRSYTILLVFVGLVSVPLAVESGRLARLLGEPAVSPFLLVGSAYVVFHSLKVHTSILFQGFNRVTWSAILTAVSGVGRVVFAVGFILLGFGAVGALLGYIVGYAFAAALGILVLYRHYYRRFPARDRRDPGLSRRILRYSVPLTATKAANVLDKRVDTILVGILLNPTAVGFYVIAKQISEVVSVPAGSFGFTVSPTFGEQKASDRVDVAARIYEEALTYTLLLYIPGAVGLILVADPVVRFIFGPDYLPAVPVVQTFGGFVLVNAINKITNDGLDYLGRARSRATIQGIMAAANFLLNLLLIPTFGVVGAAVATVITYTGYTLGNVYFIHQELSFRVGRIVRNGVLVLGISGGMTLVVATVLPYVSGLPSLFGVVLLGGGVWAILSTMTGILDPQRVATFLR